MVARRECERIGVRLAEFGQAGIGIAMLILIESTVTATIRHSDSEPIASVPATASVNPGEATGALGPPNPVVPGDRVMVKSFEVAPANHPRQRENLAPRRQQCGEHRVRKWRDRRKG
jgi:hypothetical protein